MSETEDKALKEAAAMAEAAEKRKRSQEAYVDYIVQLNDAQFVNHVVEILCRVKQDPHLLQEAKLGIQQHAHARAKAIVDAREATEAEAKALKEDHAIFALKAIAKQIAECTHHDELLAVLSALRKADRLDFHQHQELIRHCHAKMATLASERADAPVDVSAITKELLR